MMNAKSLERASLLVRDSNWLLEKIQRTPQMNISDDKRVTRLIIKARKNISQAHAIVG